MSENATPSQCDAAMKFLEPAVRAGGEAVSLSQVQINDAWATASELGSDGRYKHVRCRRPDTRSKARCEYAFDVKRMNVKPGSSTSSSSTRRRRPRSRRFLSTWRW